MRTLQLGSIQIYCPFIIDMLSHWYHVLKIPVTQYLTSAQQSESLTITQLRSTNNNTDCLSIVTWLHLLRSLVVDAVSKGTTIQVGILRYHLPVIVERIFRSLLRCHIQAMLHQKPFSLQNNALTYYAIKIGVSLLSRFYTPIIRPALTIERGQRKLHFLIIFLNVDDNLLAEHCLIRNMKMYNHKTQKGYFVIIYGAKLRKISVIFNFHLHKRTKKRCKRLHWFRFHTYFFNSFAFFF